MTPAVVVQIIGWSVQAISTIAELVKTALEGAEPKTLDQLDAELIAIIGSRVADRAKAAVEAKAAADKALADAAAAEFDTEPKKP
jgi:hypothetical protein